MVIFLSAGLLEGLQEELQKGGYDGQTPAAIVYKASWPEERVCRCTVATLAETAKAQASIRRPSSSSASFSAAPMTEAYYMILRLPTGIAKER